jgi:DNA polymerase III subunit alpha
LLAELDAALQGADQAARNQASGIADLFGAADTASAIVHPSVTPRALTRRERLDAEKEALGLYLTGHPLDEYLAEIREFCPTPIADLRVERRAQVVAGHVFQNRTMRNKRGELLAFTVLDDGSGRIELSVYADVYEKHKAKIFKDAVLVAEGEVQQDDYNDGLKMKVAAIYTMDDARRHYAECLQIEVNGDATADLAHRLRRLLAPFRQNVCPVAIAYRSRAAEGRLVLGPEWRVAPSDELLQSLRNEFGAGHVGLHYHRSAA